MPIYETSSTEQVQWILADSGAVGCFTETPEHSATVREVAGPRAFRRRLLDAVHIDRLNLGPVPTTQLNWRQPHEGNIVDFLFRARAFQSAPVGG